MNRATKHAIKQIFITNSFKYIYLFTKIKSINSRKLYIKKLFNRLFKKINKITVLPCNKRMN